MIVKICGIASEEDARVAAASGADLAGFLAGLVYPSPDAVEAGEARRLARGLPATIRPVLVTHRTDPDLVAALLRETGFSAVQLHGEFPIREIPALRDALPGLFVSRVVHVDGPEAIARGTEVARFADAVHLDTRVGDRLGGTGTTHDWGIAAEIVRSCGKPVLLAGGLTPENVARAVRTVRPWAVDVNSGVEDAEGRKSPERCRAFALAARATSPEASSGPSGRT